MDAKDNKHVYFIVIETSINALKFGAGQICYIEESKYMEKIEVETLMYLPVVSLGNVGEEYLKVTYLEQVSVHQAELLFSVGESSQRLRYFKEREALDKALSLTKDTAVSVEMEGTWLQGIIRYIGRITEPLSPDPITGTYFGIELLEEDRGKGQNDGFYMGKRYFTCQQDCGVFAPFSRVRHLVSNPVRTIADQPPGLPVPTESLQLSSAGPLSTGDRVIFFLDNDMIHGMVMGLEEKESGTLVIISTDIDERGGTDSVHVPLENVIKEEVFPLEPKLNLESLETEDVTIMPAEEIHPLGLNVNSLVEVTLGKGPSYGTIRWIGFLPGREGTMAGLELEQEDGVSDGTFKGKRYFSCPTKRGLFIKLLSCQPDSRFQAAGATPKEQRTDSPGDLPSAPITSEQVEKMLIGRMKGIQGHINSCYMDSALFSLFCCSSVLDSLLFKRTEPQDAPIQRTLLHDIVNPLRSKGFVEGRHVMKLRQQLQALGYCHTFTTDEKDPEEFLTLVMHNILCLDPLLKLSAGGKVQESYCYQIFLDHNHSLVLPNVQQLLEHSFMSAGLKLAEVPSCLILQMPRFGKTFKMFPKIIPSLELDITDLLSEGPQQCVLCGQLAYEECMDCFTEPVFSRTGFKLFCRTCSTQVHSHPERMSHSPSPLSLPEGYPTPPGFQCQLTTPPRERLQLFAVLSIETSHYVSFIKHGPKNTDWIFFDSMADRQGEKEGFNIPQVEACPEVGMYLNMSPAELANQIPRDMKGVAKRLFCDAYMYLYQSTNMSLYR
ncbi:ubiquitin carboxyl-terminal hydrolase CYLD [Esox lucius]|uniref:ubiquitinyl hydrolase 1 n=1 Tax=Esox lucius TaxID=8010 RepID=A0A6Q2YGF9_ESOLU|nr:ubiquitin carboxyl-terminal hydrolase CYLD [Esox lucius]